MQTLGQPGMEGTSGLLSMDSQAAQKGIDSILKTLDEAKQRSGLVPDDPSVIALEGIMLAKVATLEASKLTAAPVPDATTPEPIK